MKREGLEHVDIGFAFLPAYEGRGYGYESASVVMKYARDVLKLDTIVAITTKHNVPSINLLKKIAIKVAFVVFRQQIENITGKQQVLIKFDRA